MHVTCKRIDFAGLQANQALGTDPTDRSYAALIAMRRPLLGNFKLALLLNFYCFLTCLQVSSNM
jgi:hypothetical protein